MMFLYSRQNLKGKEYIRERIFEILPGLTSWTSLVGLLALPFWKPVAAAVIIIVFDFYWLLRLSYHTLFLALSFLRLKVEKGTDWMGRIKELDRVIGGRNQPLERPSHWRWQQEISKWIFSRDLQRLKKSGVLPPSWQDIYHLVIVPMAKEKRQIVEPGIESYLKGNFPSEHMIVVLAVEGWARDEVKRAARELQEHYRASFYDFLVVIHPENLPHESRVKGANVTYAAKQADECLLKNKIPVENVIVSCFDADTIVSEEYFACLTYSFLVCPQRNRASFQPIPVYHNNIWDVPGFARVLEMGASFFQLTEATQPDKLVTFSSHSMSFKALKDVGYWPVDLVSDDSAIFWKAYLYFEGDYRVVPMYVTLSMDVAEAGSWWKTCVNVYKQKRRWAWGVENFPIVMRGFLKSRQIPLYQKIRHGIKLFEGHFAWATWPLILGVVGWLPAIYAEREFSSTVLYYTAPRISAIIFDLASLSLIITIILSLCFLPKKVVKHSFLRKTVHAFEWLLIPAVAVFLSALPALDAQSRLMLGKYMDFWVTDKRKSIDSFRERVLNRYIF